MGEKIRVLASVLSGVAIELNKPSQAGGQRTIHVQTDSFRLSLTEHEFIQIAATTAKAAKKLRHMKGMEE